MFVARFKPVTNQSDWITNIQFTDKATGTPITLTGITFVMQLALIGRYYSNQNTAGALLTLGTATGELTNPSPGILTVTVPVTRMQTLMPGTYNVGLTMTNGIITAQVFIGQLPVINGIVGTGTTNNPWGDYD